MASSLSPSVATQTVFVPAPPHSQPIPIAPIAGGAVGGITLAILLVLLWRLWTKKLRKQAEKDHRERLRRKAYQAALAHRHSVLHGSPRLLSVSSKSPADRTVKFKSDAPASAVPQTQSANSISLPKALKPHLQSTDITGANPSSSAHSPISVTNTASSNSDPSIPPVPQIPPAFRHPSSRNRSFTPRRPSPLRPARNSDRSANASTSAVPYTSLSLKARDADAEKEPAPTRRPRLKTSLSSLRRHSKASSSSSDASSRRFSWRSLITGPGFSFRQAGIGTGKNRLSAESSLLADWTDLDPSLPIGYAVDGVDGVEEGVVDREKVNEGRNRRTDSTSHV